MQFVNEIIKEEDFIPIANKASRNMLIFAAHFLKNKNKTLSKKYYVTSVKESMELEDFLDDHGARNNKKWVYFGEIVASVRNFSSTAYMISHMLSRIKFYKLNSKTTASFIKDAAAVLDFMNTSISSLFSNLNTESKNLGLTIPQGNLDEEKFDESIVAKVLPQNIDDEGVSDIHDNISRVVAEFISAFNNSRTIMFEKKLSSKNLDNKIIPDKINEETLRNLEVHVHNAQSMYDTYIQKTPFETENAMLSSLRGHISITLHLLTVAKELSHFFERHETCVRQETTRKKIAKIIQSKNVLHAVINFALYYYTLFITDGHAHANTVLNKFTITESEIVSVPEGLGFHLRPSTLVVKVANHYGAKVTLIVNQKEFDASSVIDIMWAGGMIKKEGVTHVEFRGDKNAVKDLKILAQANYGEDPMGNSTPLPEKISYLRQD
ncbi:MAG: HPr family phosphocarrier protein [Pseudomonadota bacterium]